MFINNTLALRGVERHAASVMLIATSEEGRIKYEVAVNFFPHTAEDDFAVSYDAYFSEVVYEAAGRRSKKREKEILERIASIADHPFGKAFALSGRLLHAYDSQGVAQG